MRTAFQPENSIQFMSNGCWHGLSLGHHSWVRFWPPKTRTAIHERPTVAWDLFESPFLGQTLVGPKKADRFPTQKKGPNLMRPQLSLDKFWSLFSGVKASRILGPPSGRGEKDFGDGWLVVVVVADRGGGWWLVVATTTSRDYFY